MHYCGCTGEGGGLAHSKQTVRCVVHLTTGPQSVTLGGSKAHCRKVADMHEVQQSGILSESVVPVVKKYK